MKAEIALVHFCEIKQIKSLHFYLKLYSIWQQVEKQEKNNLRWICELRQTLILLWWTRENYEQWKRWATEKSRLSAIILAVH